MATSCGSRRLVVITYTCRAVAGAPLVVLDIAVGHYYDRYANITSVMLLRRCERDNGMKEVAEIDEAKMRSKLGEADGTVR